MSRPPSGSASRVAAVLARPLGSTSSTSAPGDRAFTAGIAQHESVAGRERQRRDEAKPRERAVGIEQPVRRAVLTRTDVHLHAAAAARASRREPAARARRRPWPASTGPRAPRRRRARGRDGRSPRGSARPGCPGPTSSTWRLAVSMPRTRTRVPRPPTSSSSSTATAPPVSVPVTTVPAPLAANTRSIHSRGRPTSRTAGVAASTASSVVRTSSRPRPDSESHTTTGARSERRSLEVLGHVELRPARASRRRRGRPW